MLQQLRRLQTTPEWKARYERRVVEGTISQGTRGFGLRRSRYMGEAKAHLQHILTASAINLVRFAAWQTGIPQVKTRISRFAVLRLLTLDRPPSRKFASSFVRIQDLLQSLHSKLPCRLVVGAQLGKQIGAMGTKIVILKREHAFT